MRELLAEVLYEEVGLILLLQHLLPSELNLRKVLLVHTDVQVRNPGRTTSLIVTNLSR